MAVIDRFHCTTFSSGLVTSHTELHKKHIISCYSCTHMHINQHWMGCALDERVRVFEAVSNFLSVNVYLMLVNNLV